MKQPTITLTSKNLKMHAKLLLEVLEQAQGKLDKLPHDTDYYSAQHDVITHLMGIVDVLLNLADMTDAAKATTFESPDTEKTIMYILKACSQITSTDTLQRYHAIMEREANSGTRTN
jgi:hypothetical protein